MNSSSGDFRLVPLRDLIWRLPSGPLHQETQVYCKSGFVIKYLRKINIANHAVHTHLIQVKVPGSVRHRTLQMCYITSAFIPNKPTFTRIIIFLY